MADVTKDRSNQEFGLLFSIVPNVVIFISSVAFLSITAYRLSRSLADGPYDWASAISFADIVNETAAYFPLIALLCLVAGLAPVVMVAIGAKLGPLSLIRIIVLYAILSVATLGGLIIFRPEDPVGLAPIITAFSAVTLGILFVYFWGSSHQYRKPISLALAVALPVVISTVMGIAHGTSTRECPWLAQVHLKDGSPMLSGEILLSGERGLLFRMPDKSEILVPWESVGMVRYALAATGKTTRRPCKA